MRNATSSDQAKVHQWGLKRDMARELLWRVFPTDQRGTTFSWFLGPAWRRVVGDLLVPKRDIEPIHTWDVRQPLGGNLAAVGTDLVVPLIRGDVLERYRGRRSTSSTGPGGAMRRVRS